MKKINGGYQSLFEYLVVQDFPFARIIDERFYPIENQNIKFERAPYGRRYNQAPKSIWVDQFIGALQPISSMFNDLQYTFKSYNSVQDSLTDAAQPIRGIGNILRGLANLIVAPLLFIANTVRYGLISGSISRFSQNMLINLGRTGSWLIDGFSALVRGSTQLITTPLVWGCKIPLRAALTAIYGSPDITENEEIQRLVDSGLNAIETGKGMQMDCIRHRLHEEFNNALLSGQKTVLSNEQEKDAFNKMNFKYGSRWVIPMQSKPESLIYLSLFRKNITIPQSDLSENTARCDI